MNEKFANTGLGMELISKALGSTTISLLPQKRKELC
jgi:hypothetical protein